MVVAVWRSRPLAWEVVALLQLEPLGRVEPLLLDRHPAPQPTSSVPASLNPSLRLNLRARLSSLDLDGTLLQMFVEVFTPSLSPFQHTHTLLTLSFLFVESLFFNS